MRVGEGRGGRLWGAEPLVSSWVDKRVLLAAALSAKPARAARAPISAQRDRAQLSPVIGLAAVGRAAVAVEALRIGIGVESEGFDRRNSGRPQAVLDISFQIEVRLAPGSIREEPRVSRVGFEEAHAKALVHLVRRLPDAGADRRANAVATGA